MFCIRAFGEEGYFSADLYGFQQIAMLLKRRDEGVPMVQLVACSEIDDNRVTADRKRGKHPVLDSRALQESGKKLKKLMGDRAHAEEYELKEEIETLTNQIDALTCQMHAAMTNTGTQKDLNSVMGKLRPRIYGTIRTALQKMREAQPPMLRLAQHFDLFITSESSCFVYRPPTSPDTKWHL